MTQRIRQHRSFVAVNDTIISAISSANEELAVTKPEIVDDKIFLK